MGHSHDTALELILQDEVARRVDELERRDRADQREGGQQFPFGMSHEVSAGVTDRNNPEEETLEVPYDGELVAVSISWEDGAGNGTGVRLRTRDGKQFIPRNEEAGFIPGNDRSKPFEIGEVFLSQGEILVAQFINFDSSNPHFIGVVPEIRAV